jgi:iron complex outermembrane receptor protein
VDWSVAATYNKTEVMSVRETPAELGSQPLFDIVALTDLTETAPKFLVNLGARFEWERLSFSVHELVYGKSAQYENDGGECFAAHPVAGFCGENDQHLTFFRTEIPVSAITNFEVSFQAMDALALTVGATNAFDKMPPRRNADFRALQFGAGDNSAVAGRPSFSPFGINGAYYYGKLVYAF